MSDHSCLEKCFRCQIKEIKVLFAIIKYVWASFYFFNLWKVFKR